MVILWVLSTLFGYLRTVKRVNYTALFWNSLRNWGKP